MEFPDDIPFNSLQNCSYRSLQQLAKSLNLPSNVKKVYLIEMIYAKKYCSTEKLDSIVTRIKEERKQSAKPRKAPTRKKKRVQGTEISSTSNHPPPICTTPTPDLSSKTMKKYNSILNPLITKQAVESDRVLRSYNNKVRRNTKYSIMNVNNSVVGVANKAQNSVSQEVQGRQYEWNMDMQKYRPIRIADSMVQRQQTSEADYVLPQPKPIYVDINGQRRDIENGERQLVPIVKSSCASATRGRRISGIYPLEPAPTYYPVSGVRFRRHDGRISKLNAVVQKPIRQPEYMIKNKMTQTTVQKSVMPRHVVVSVRNALQRKMPTIQDVISYKIDGQFSNSSTESARESSPDRVITPRMIASKSFQETFEDEAFVDKRDIQMKNRYPIENAKKQAERYRSAQMSKRNVENQRPVDGAIYAREYQPRRTNNIAYAMDTQTAHVGNRMQFKNNEIRVYTTDTKNLSKNVENQNQRMYTIGRQSEPKTYLAKKSNKTTDNKKYGKTTNKVDNSDYLIDILKAENDIESSHDNSDYIINISKRQEKNTGILNSDYVIDITQKQDDDTMVNANLNLATESIRYTQNEPKNVHMTQNSSTAGNTGGNETDYRNMSALTDVYPEDQSKELSEALNEPSRDETVYYYKKTREDQVRTQRPSTEPRVVKCTLPHISDVFNQCNKTRHKNLTQTRVDVGDAEKEKSSVKGPLESLYNYNNSELDQPLNFHHIFSTTNTSCVYSTHTMTTAVARTPATGHTQGNSSQYESLQYYTGPQSIADRERDSLACDAVLQYSPGSDVSSILRCTPESDATNVPSDLDADISARAGAESIEDALELISQDGDYMERIGMDVRMQCILCDWAGPKSILEYHIGLEHPAEVISRPNSTWSSTIKLGGARSGLREISERCGRLYVLSVRCVAVDCFQANITMLPKDEDTEYFTKYGRLTVYNKKNGEPHIWEGIITELPQSHEDTEARGVSVALSSLDLLPNSANLKLVNGEWVVNSTAKVVVGQVELNDIDIAVHVEVYD